MRRILNVLQATAVAAAAQKSASDAGVAAGTAVAVAAAGTITRDTVYNCTGSPLPSDVDAIATLLLNAPFAQAFAEVRVLRTHVWRIRISSRHDDA